MPLLGGGCLCWMPSLGVVFRCCFQQKILGAWYWGRCWLTYLGWYLYLSCLVPFFVSSGLYIRSRDVLIGSPISWVVQWRQKHRNMLPTNGARKDELKNLIHHPVIRQPTKKPSNQSTSPSTSQSINQSLTSQSISQSVSQSVNYFVSQSVSQLLCQSVSQSVNYFVSQSVSQSVSQRANQANNESWTPPGSSIIVKVIKDIQWSIFRIDQHAQPFRQTIPLNVYESSQLSPQNHSY